MGFLFNFGEKVDAFDYKVINERDARASAGIMFLLGMLSFFLVFVNRTLFWVELFSITFIIEFMVRTIINPKYAPYMLIGSLIVSNQEPDWVEAKPKQFAWVLGLILGISMTFFILLDIVSLVRLGICSLCMVLLFVESVFGICLGCIVYKKLNWKLYNCPGGICEITNKRKYEKRNYIIILLFLFLFSMVFVGLKSVKYTEKPKIVINN